MTPYYQREGVTIYCGDCLEIMPQLEPGSVDAVVTDPPYGIGYVARVMGARESRCGVNQYATQGVTGDDKPFDPSPLLALNVSTVLWGANHYANYLPAASRWLVWDKKTNPQYYGRTTFADCELAWSNANGPALIFPHIWNGIVRQGEEAARAGSGRLHPTQKPVALILWTLQVCAIPIGAVLDPFLGSGTTAVACIRTDRRCIGIEIEEHYCEIAARRCDKELDQGRLNFDVEPCTHIDESLR